MHENPIAGSESAAPHQPSASVSPDRVSFIDGMRGVAAIAVAAFHILCHGSEPDAWLAGVQRVAEHGWLGVPVFFVISGFVIANSLRNTTITASTAGRYALRRSIRLDPPYWLAIAATITFGLVTAAWVNEPLRWPTWGALAAHAVYLQNLLRITNLSQGLWTLCLEVQFYTTYLLLLCISQRLRVPLVWLVIPPALAVLCLSVRMTSADADMSVWLSAYRSLLPNWSMFAMGISVWLYWQRQISARWLIVFAALVIARLAWWFQPALLAAMVAAGVMHVGILGYAKILEGRVAQFFGRISYSLYLIHAVAAEAFLLIVHRLVRRHPSNSLAWALSAMLAAMVVAALMYLVVERPALRLARKLSIRPRPQP